MDPRSRPPAADDARLLAALEELAAALSGATDAESIGRVALETAQRVLGAEVGAAYALDGRGRLLLVHAISSDGDSLAGIAPDRGVERGDPLSDALLDGGVRTFDEHAAYAAVYPQAAARHPGVGSVALVGLGRDGSASGALALGWSHPHAVDRAGRAFLGTIARVATQGMDRVMAEARQRRRAEGLARTLSAIAAESSPGAIAQALLREAMPAADAVFGSVRVLSDDGFATVLIGQLGYAAPVPYEAVPLSDPAPPTDAILTGEAVLLTDPGAIAAAYPNWVPAFEAFGPRAVAALPIKAGDRAIGSLTLGWPAAQGFDEGQLAHVRALADAAAAALERARHAEEEARLRLLFSETLRQLPLGVIVAEPAAGLVFQSDEVNRILGAPLPLGRLAEGALERTLPDGTPLAMGEWPIMRALQGEATEGLESLVRRVDDGRVVRLLSSARPVRRDGVVVAAVSVFTDVTAARDAEVAREAFLSVLSHELRTPLTSVYGGALVLERHRGELPSAFEPVVVGIADDASRLLRLIEDLLVLARIERGAQLAGREPVSMGAVLRRVARAEVARWPGVDVRVAIDPATPAVLADEGPLEVVVRNVVGNAAKYGAHRIDVITRLAGDRVQLQVLDDGPGLDLPPDDLFRLFRRGPDAARRAPGSGIGLYVSRALVDAMGGSIEAAIRPDGGSAFTILLQAAPDEE